VSVASRQPTPRSPMGTTEWFLLVTLSVLRGGSSLQGRRSARGSDV
jgi:hypothetical protein